MGVGTYKYEMIPCANCDKPHAPEDLATCQGCEEDVCKVCFNLDVSGFPHCHKCIGASLLGVPRFPGGRACQ